MFQGSVGIFFHILYVHLSMNHLFLMWQKSDKSQTPEKCFCIFLWVNYVLEEIN